MDKQQYLTNQRNELSNQVLNAVEKIQHAMTEKLVNAIGAKIINTLKAKEAGENLAPVVAMCVPKIEKAIWARNRFLRLYPEG